MCVFLDLQIGMDNAPMVQTTTIKSIISMDFEVPKMDDVSIPESSAVQLEEPCNNENQEINASKMQHTSSETQIFTHQLLPIAGTSSSVDVDKSMLSIILDLNGLLLKRSPQPSSHHKSVEIDSNRYVILRPGCIQFLKTILERFNVAIWSTATRNNVLQILRALDSLVGYTLPFFAIWCQDGCFTAQSHKIYRPDNPNVEAMFKPLAKIAMGFECDPQRTLLIDDSPYKGCISPANNCIFPPQFDGEKMVDNILLEELLPYLFEIDESRDVRDFIASNRYGQPAVVVTNDSEYKQIMEFWKPKSDVWSAKVFFTKRIPPAKGDRGVEDKSDTSHRTKMRKAQIQEILAKEHTPIESMKATQLINLARQLGCNTKGALKATTAKAYINRVKAENNLLTLDKKQP